MNARHHFYEGDYKRAIDFVDLAIDETEYLVKHNPAQQKMHPTLGESAASDNESTPAPKRVI
jgi:hypothetical protein